jgi:hypothetical protein
MPPITEEDALQNVRITMRATNDWLLENIGPPNRDATSWRLGEWCIEIHYVSGEGTLEIWRQGVSSGRKLVTRGRNDADLQLWMDTLEACKP